jgi:hypothetical protein
VSESFFEGRRQCDDERCPWCARLFFAWLKARMGQMSVPRKAKVMPSGFVKPAETVSFAEAAATSNIPQREV